MTPSPSTSHRTQVAIALIGATAVVLAAIVTSGFGLLSNDRSALSTATSNNANGGDSRNTGSCVSGGVVVQAPINCVREARHERAVEDRYQRQVVATCNTVRRLSKRNTLGTPQANTRELLNLQPQNVFYFDRDTVISGERETLAAIKRRLRLLFARPVPTSLRDEEKVARRRALSYLRESLAVVTAFADSLPTSPTLPQINAAAGPLRDRKDKATAGLENALTQLAERECNLPNRWPVGAA